MRLIGVVVAVVALIAPIRPNGQLPAYEWLVAAGGVASGSRDGSSEAAQFFSPSGIAFDQQGNAYVVDSGNHTIRRIDSAGRVSTLAGQAGSPGLVDGSGVDSRFRDPTGLAMDSDGSLIVADTGNHVLRRVTATGGVTTFGSGAGLVSPTGLAVEARDRSVYVANSGAHTVVRISPDGTSATVAGLAGAPGAVDGIGANARFRNPRGVAIDPSTGTVWVSDAGNFTVRTIDSNGLVATVLGAPGQAGDQDGDLHLARFDGPSMVVPTGAGNFSILDRVSGCCRSDRLRLLIGGTVRTVVGVSPGAGASGFQGLAQGPEGAYFLSDASTNSILRVTTVDQVGGGSFLNTVATYAGRGTGCTTAYPLDGHRLAARFCSIRSVAVGVDGVMYVADAGNSNIRRVAPDGSTTTLAGGTRVSGSADGIGTVARFGSAAAYPRSAMGIDVDGAGNVWVADTANSTIRRIAPDGTTVTVAGLAGSVGAADGPGLAARFNQPHDLAVDSAGNVFVADTGNSSIRKVTPAGVVTTVAGLSGTGGSLDGAAASARFNAPYGLSIGPDDSVYIADTGNHTIRRLIPGGQVTTIAGVAGSAGTVDGSGAAVRFNSPQSLAVDSGGHVFVGSYSNTIRRISPAGDVTTVSPPFSCGSGCVDGYGAVTDVDAAGTLYVPHSSTIVVGTMAGQASAAPAIASPPSSQTVPAGQTARFVVAASGVPAPTYLWQQSVDGGTTWTTLSDGARSSGTSTSSLSLSALRVTYPFLQVRAIATNAFGAATSDAAVITVPGLLVQPSALRFRVRKPQPAGPVAEHPGQELLATFVAVAPGNVTWSADAPWVRLVTVLGGGAAVSVDIHDGGNALGNSTNASATITGSAPGVGPVQIPVSLEIVHAGGSSAEPFGQVDTPSQGATGVQGAVAVSGWAIDDIGVSTVLVYRNCLADEPPANCQLGVIPGRSTDRVVSLGAAQLVPGARPDIEAAFPQHPGNRAGWGFHILTNMLPRSTTGYSPHGGQGPVTLYAVAVDGEGQRTLLGRNWANDATPTTITLDNDAISKPFGTLDTPGAGDRVTSDTLHSFGWVLTPDADTIQGNSDIAMGNASGLTLFIDGMPVSPVTYNQCRGTVGNPVPAGVYCNDDIGSTFGNVEAQALFTLRTSNPTRYRNLDEGRGAIGAAVVDATRLSNGLHTIAWSATDSAGRVEGIGSRYFTVLRPQTAPATDVVVPARVDRGAASGEAPGGAVLGREGFDLDAPWVALQAGRDGVRRVTIQQMGRVEFWLGGAVTSFDLPVGSRLDAAVGHFAWIPGPAFLGTYRLAFTRADGPVLIEVTTRATHAAAPGASEVRMAPLAVGGCEDLPLRDCSVTGPVTLVGRAWDPYAFAGSGIGTVHLWTLRRDQPHGTAQFLGAAAMDTDGTYTLTHALDRGVYDITAYAWSHRTGRFEDARTVRVTVR